MLTFHKIKKTKRVEYKIWWKVKDTYEIWEGIPKEITLITLDYVLGYKLKYWFHLFWGFSGIWGRFLHSTTLCLHWEWDFHVGHPSQDNPKSRTHPETDPKLKNMESLSFCSFSHIEIKLITYGNLKITSNGRSQDWINEMSSRAKKKGWRWKQDEKEDKKVSK